MVVKEISTQQWHQIQRQILPLLTQTSSTTRSWVEQNFQCRIEEIYHPPLSGKNLPRWTIQITFLDPKLAVEFVLKYA